MSLNIAEHEIRDVLIVEDDDTSRETYGYSVEELGLQPILEPGPIPSLDEYVEKAIRDYDAAICDHHLRIRSSDYASFNGAELVSRLNQKNRPAILCTGWEEASIDEIRRFRKYIPFLLKPDELDPDNIRRAFELCITEFEGLFQPSRRPWRTLIRVEDVDERFAYVVIPGWNVHEVVKLPKEDVGSKARAALSPGVRVHAYVNIGAETQEELYFDRWESE